MEANSSENTLRLLRDKGVRFGTAVDIGSADGSHFLHMHRLGLLPDAVIFNVDPRSTNRHLSGFERFSAVAIPSAR